MPLRMMAALLLLGAATGAAVAADAPSTRYSMRYDAASETMSVRLCVPYAAEKIEFTADDGAPRFVEAPTREHGIAPSRNDDGWSATRWRADECLAYRARLGRIADSGDRDIGARHGETLVTDPDVWLLRVDGTDPDRTAEVDVELPSGVSISVPWHPLPSTETARRFAMPQTPRDWLARVAIGPFKETPVPLPGGTLRLAIVNGADAKERGTIAAWIQRVGDAAAKAYGRFPLPDVQALVIPTGRSDEAIDFGQSTRGEGHGLTLFVDPSRSADELARSWVAVHELSHLYHPYIEDSGSWLAEGLATYYQNVLRARAGLLTAAEAWEQLDSGFDRGRRATARDRGITLERASRYDGHPNFLRIYWSGTAFWLEADTELRRSSGNRLSVDEALRRFDACCLPSYRAWQPAEFVAKLDALIGSDVFRRHFSAYAKRRDFPDVTPLYRELGIARAGKDLEYDESAPAADARRAIMSAPAASMATR